MFPANRWDVATFSFTSRPIEAWLPKDLTDHWNGRVRPIISINNLIRTYEGWLCQVYRIGQLGRAQVKKTTKFNIKKTEVFQNLGKWLWINRTSLPFPPNPIDLILLYRTPGDHNLDERLKSSDSDREDGVDEPEEKQRKCFTILKFILTSSS